MHSDIAEALDKGSMTELIMLDSSVDFEIVDHPILLKHLEISFGIQKNAFTWIKSYIADRNQCISLAENTSPDVDPQFNVPQ